MFIGAANVLNEFPAAAIRRAAVHGKAAVGQDAKQRLQNAGRCSWHSPCRKKALSPTSDSAACSTFSQTSTKRFYASKPVRLCCYGSKSQRRAIRESAQGACEVSVGRTDGCCLLLKRRSMAADIGGALTEAAAISLNGVVSVPSSAQVGGDRFR